MINNSPRRIAYKTLLKNRLSSAPSYDDLQRIIESNQFTIIKYKKNSNSEYVSELINKLGIEYEIEHSDSFLYLKNNLRLIFLNSDIPDEDKRLRLYHELGHILDPCLENSNLIYSKTKKEEFANEFSCYIKNPSTTFKLFMFIIKKWKLLISILTTIIVISVILSVINSNTTPSIPSMAGVTSTSEIFDDIYYVTSSGKKYHKKNCIVVKYRTNLTKYTLNEAVDAGYKPCLICLPEEEK